MDAFLFNVVARDALLPMQMPNSIVAPPDDPCRRKGSLHSPKPGSKFLHLSGEVIEGMKDVVSTSVEHNKVWMLWCTTIANDFHHTPEIIQPGRLCESCDPTIITAHVIMTREAEFDEDIM